MMSNSAKIQHYSSSFGSDIRNHDYGGENKAAENSPNRSLARNPQPPVPSPQRVGSPNRVVYKSSRISMINETSKPKSKDWLSFIPPLPGDDISPENIIAVEQSRMSRNHEFRHSPIDIPDFYKQRNGSAASVAYSMSATHEMLNSPQPTGPSAGAGSLLGANPVGGANSANSAAPVTDATANIFSAPLTQPKKTRKVCSKCSDPIAGQFVRAMGMTFHMDCFRCAECDTPCSLKFFPSERTVDGKKVQVPLCEYDYFKNLDLICYTCNQALRGSYIAAIGHKYHLEHFTCSICNKVFETDESFYDHDNGIYCHYHYSKLFAKHCESCETPILKQFIELFKGGRFQQWHPECFMCYRFWNVMITVDCINPPQVEIDNFKISLALVSRIWSTLSTFEEEVASYIIEMLEFATRGNHIGGLNMAAKLVLKAEYLFKAFDSIEKLKVEEVLKKVQEDELKRNEQAPNEVALKSKYVPLQSKPRSFSAKLLSYLVYVKKSMAKDSQNHEVSKRLISIIIGISNYLKLILTCGLNNILEYNKLAHNQAATDRFLKEVEQHRTITRKTDPYAVIAPLVPVNSTDMCFKCEETIEESCIKFYRANNIRWHTHCLVCANCEKGVDESTIDHFTFSVSKNQVYCPDCTLFMNDPCCQTGFEFVSKLMQIIYISEIALVRVKYVMEKSANARGNTTEKQLDADAINSSQIVDTIKRMKSLRQQQSGHSKSAESVARKSTIINAPQPNKAGMANQDDILDYKKSVQLYDDSRMEIREEYDEPDVSASPAVVTNLLRGGRLALDDIHRIVSAEETKQLLPNAFKHAKNIDNEEAESYSKLIQKYERIEKGEVENNPKNKRTPSGKYYSELSPEEHFILRHIAVVVFCKECPDNYTIDKLLDLIPTRKPQTFWGRIKGSSKKSSSKGPKVFGAPLEEVVEKYGTESERAVGPKVVKIPAFVEDCLAALRQKDMSAEGVFRKNGNIRRLRELTESINENPSNLPDFSNESQIQLSALMKKFLREMPDPLFTFKLYDLWIESQKHEDSEKSSYLLKLVVCMLPKVNRDLLEVLSSFFNWVSSFSYIDENTGSKMTVHNLATVLAPNLLYRKEDNDALAVPPGAAPGGNVLKINTEAGDGYLRSIEVLDLLIRNHLQFSKVPHDLMGAYYALLKEDASMANSGDSKNPLNSKDLIAKITALLEKKPDLFKGKVVAGSESQPANLISRPTVVKKMSNLEAGTGAVVNE